MDSKKRTLVVIDNQQEIPPQQLFGLLSNADIICLFVVNQPRRKLLSVLNGVPGTEIFSPTGGGSSAVESALLLVREQPDAQVVLIYLLGDIAEKPYFVSEVRIRDNTQYPRAQRFGTGSQSHSKSTFHRLTDREKEILESFAEGARYRDVAVRLGISGETVKTHIKNICCKLGVKNRIAAIIKYHRETMEDREIDFTR